jgi:hypothetical protein
VFHTAIDMMEVIRQLVAEGWRVTAEDLAQLSPCLTPTSSGSAPTQPKNSTSRQTCSTPALDEVDFGGEQPAAA